MKDFWGRKARALSLPRAPIIDYKGIAAVQGEQGTFLGDNLVNTASEERFLDLSGWKDAAGMDEPKVDGDQQEYLLQPQRGRDAIRHW